MSSFKCTRILPDPSNITRVVTITILKSSTRRIRRNFFLNIYWYWQYYWPYTMLDEWFTAKDK